MNDFYSGNIITIWVVVFVFEIAMGMLAQAIAEKKGHSRRWFWAGLLASLIGVIWAAGLPDETLRRQLGAMHQLREPDSPKPNDGDILQPAIDGDKELVSVLSAAVAAIGEEEGRQFVLRSFRPAGEGSTAWNRFGRGNAAHVPR